jgi:NDP-sugar pyrophosphorylase family protein
LKELRLRAVVLAAVQGNRLRPLTEFAPKPLLPVQGEAIASRTLGQLARLGCEAAAVNLCHMGESIRQHLGDSVDGMPLTYSPEEELLGTLGALGPLEEFLRPADLVLVINGDSLCRWPLKRLVKKHRKSGAKATMLVSRRADPRPFGGGVRLDEKNHVVAFRGSAGATEKHRCRVFMGAHVLSPGLLGGIKKGQPSDFVADLYEPLLSRGGFVGAVETSRPWHDLGTPQRYLEGVRDWVGRRLLPGVGSQSWVSEGTHLATGVKLRRSVVETDCRINEGCHLGDSLLLPGARVSERCHVTGSILGFGVVLPPGTSVEARLVTTVRASSSPRPEDTVVGGLVYSPLVPVGG